MRAIILAGGKGIRLKPYTTFIPKPLVPIGNELPILEIIIRQLSQFGFTHITLTVSHLSQLIMAYFQDGKQWNVKIDYSLEDGSKPLSTIGPLTLIKDLPENFLVMNGDVLCNLNYKEFLEYHISNNNEVTVSSFKRQSKIDFGVLKYDNDNKIIGFHEKPVYDFDVSMGIYGINKSVVTKLAVGEKYGFDDLMYDGIKANKMYEVKPFNGFWIDIGRPEDYDYCNDNYEKIKQMLEI